MKAALAYVRVSTNKQDLGPDAQRAQIRAFAEREKYSIAEADWFEEKVSRTTGHEERMAFVQLLHQLADHGEAVLVANRTRVAGDVFVATAMDRAVEKLGARILSTDGTPSDPTPEGVFIRRILDASSEFEIGQIRSRTKAALGVLRTRGRKTGGFAPFGARVERVWNPARDKMEPWLVPEPAELEVIEWMASVRAEGASIREIMREARALGYRQRNGKPFASGTVSTILRNGIPKMKTAAGKSHPTAASSTRVGPGTG